MSRVVSINETASSHPVSYDDGYQASAVTYLERAYNDSTNTTYATIYLTRGANATTQIFYNFGDLGIPNGATINSVSCSCKCYISTTNTNRISTRQVQLYSGSSAKGTASTFSNSTTAFNITAGSWTANELNDAKIRINVVRGTSNTGSTYYVRFYGATLNVSYSINTTAYTVTASSTYTGATVDPASQEIYHSNSGSVSIYTSDLSSIEVTDNGIDVTDSLQYVIPQIESFSFTGVPTVYDSDSSSYYDTYNDTSNNAVDGVYNGNVPENGLRAQNSSVRACVFSNTGSSAESKLVYAFDCSSIPSNATITSVTCVAGASCYQSGQYFATKTLQLYSGNTPKGSSVDITGNGSTAANHTVNGGSWTRSELDNIRIVERIERSTSDISTAASFNFWGATITVQYTLPSEPYYVYNLTNVTTDHTIIVGESIIEPPEEEPDKTYYSVTISSINATTEPGRGTTRVESGTSEVITIYPSDPQITLVTDNGVDITSQLVAHGGTIQDPTVSTAAGATYGFVYSASTGYYVSNNKGVSKSAAVCVVNFDLPVNCLVTIQYINYAEATYDFGVFGNVDVSLSNDYYAAGSNGATITDSNYKLACNTNTYNTSSPQTLTYEMPSGQHSIYIKYSKDDASDSNNDTLQFKILSIEPLETNNYYTYNLNNVNTNHSLVFIFGDVTYYFVNSSINGDARIYPDGQMVQLPGDTYKLTIVPTESGNTVSITDNNVDVTSNLVQKTETLEKSGQTITVVNYIYTLNNIQATHNINVVCVAQESNIIYTRQGGSWSKNTNIYVKENGSWLQHEISIDLFDENRIYLNNL